MCVLDPVNKNILDKTDYGFKDWFITDYVYKDWVNSFNLRRDHGRKFI